MTLVYVYKASNSKVYKTNESTSKLDVWVSFARRETFIPTVCLGGPQLATSLLLPSNFQDFEEKDRNMKMRERISGHLETEIAQQESAKEKRDFLRKIHFLFLFFNIREN